MKLIYKNATTLVASKVTGEGNSGITVDMMKPAQRAAITLVTNSMTGEGNGGVTISVMQLT